MASAIPEFPVTESIMTEGKRSEGGGRSFREHFTEDLTWVAERKSGKLLLVWKMEKYFYDLSEPKGGPRRPVLVRAL